MNRRELFLSMCGLATCGAVGVRAAPVKKYGCLTVRGHLHHKQSTGEDLHVYCDGAEMHSVYEANDELGYVLCFCRDPEMHRAGVKAGHMHVRGPDGEACRVAVHGHVVIKPGPVRA